MKAVSRLSNLQGLRRLILYFALVSSSQFAMGANDTAKASAYYENALEYYNNEQYDEAVIELKNALQENPDLLSALVLLGKTYLETGNPAAAETAFSDALELGADPSAVIVHLTKAYIAQFKHDLLLAQQVDSNLPPNIQLAVHLLRAKAALETNNQAALDHSLNHAEKLDSLAADLLALKATLMMREGKLDKAEEFVNRLTDIYPKNSVAWLTNASLKHLQDNSEAALEGYEKVIELAPKSADARIARIGLLLNLDRDPNTHNDFTALSEFAAKDPRVSYLRAVALAKTGDYFGSTSALNETLNTLDIIGPDIFTRNLQLLMVAAITNNSLGNFDSARTYLERYVEFSPDELAPRRMLANIYMRQNEYSSAIEQLKIMLELNPEDPQILNMLAQTYDASGKYQLAILTFEKALNQEGKSPLLETQLAISKLNAGFLEQGLDELNKLFSNSQQNIASGMALVVTYMNEGKYEQAINTAQTLVKQAPADPAKKNLLAIAYVGKGELEKARTLFESVLKQLPGNSSVIRNLAKIDIKQGNYQTAHNQFKQLLANDKNNPDLMLEMARVSYEKGDLADAIRWSKSAASQAPNSFTINAYLTELLLENNEVEEALKIAQAQESLYSKNLYALELQVKVLMATSKKNQLLSLLRSMVNLADFNPQWLLKIARYQIAAGSLEEASYTLFQGLQGNPQHFETRILLTEVEIQLDRTVQATERAKQLINDYPNAAEGYRLMGDVRMERKQFTNAIHSYSIALEKSPSVIRLLRLHVAHRSAGQNSQSETVLTDWLRQNPDDSEVQNVLAEYYLSTSQLSKASEIYRELLQTLEDNPFLNNNLAYSLHKLGQTKDAIIYAHRAYELAPTNPMINDTLGWLLVSNEQASQGLPYLREALTRASGNLQIQYHLGVALAKLGRYQEAKKVLTTALGPKIKFEGRSEAEKLLKKLINDN